MQCRLATTFAGLLMLGGCASQNPADNSSQYARMTTSALWVEHSFARSPLDLAFIEAELGSRGERRSSARSSYLGQKTSSAQGRQLYSRTASGTSDLDCSDFNSAASAQKAFLAAGGPVNDPNNLDRDGDGLACEWGTYLRQSVVSYRASVAPTRVRSTPRRSSSQCYVGPRGGTYTITASGNKNYGGC